MPDHYIAWWNVENLFDHATATRPDYLRAKLRSELVGWTAAVRDAKIAQLASVITQMNNQKGPDILGVCEIENATVMTLPGMTAGLYNTPRRFGRPAKAASFDPTGFSDHLPICGDAA
jgi:hypothetical protein